MGQCQSEDFSEKNQMNIDSDKQFIQKGIDQNNGFSKNTVSTKQTKQVYTDYNSQNLPQNQFQTYNIHDTQFDIIHKYNDQPNDNSINNENLTENRDSLQNSKKQIPKLPQFSYGQNNVNQNDKNKPFLSTQHLPNGCVYVGEWFGEKMSGRGVLTWPDGSKYEGYFIEGRREGRGRFTSSDGDIYEGEWKNNQAYGYGTQYTEVSTYTGQWKEDLQEGQGEEEWIDGSRYKGQYSVGKKHGNGVFIWYDGTQYEGQFQQGSITGFGKMKYHNGKKYEGTFKDGKLNGKGSFVWPDGKQYNGEYVNDKKQGYGVFFWTDGRKYEGNWFNGLQNGTGIFYDHDGLPNKREWQDGRLIEQIIQSDPTTQVPPQNRSMANPKNDPNFNQNVHKNLIAKDSQRQPNENQGEHIIQNTPSDYHQYDNELQDGNKNTNKEVQFDNKNQLPFDNINDQTYQNSNYITLSQLYDQSSQNNRNNVIEKSNRLQKQMNNGERPVNELNNQKQEFIPERYQQQMPNQKKEMWL